MNPRGIVGGGVREGDKLLSARADVAAPANVLTEDNHNQEQDSPGSVEDGEILIVFPCRAIRTDNRSFAGTVNLHGGCVGLLGIQIGAEFDCVGLPGTVNLRRQRGNSTTVPIPAANPATNLPTESPHKPR
ncbi:hypothetical protein H0E87_006303 [Populus deltoides]|uniref:Uncharacterized protein n=1 Tax=Populus deltoides TaxID=3696 RepID=A0A8T2Z6H5_POPDE|nr:hypothetical protein H0E87_006303 [Populus deltoides]